MKNISFTTKLLTISLMLVTSSLFPIEKSKTEKAIRYMKQYLQEITSELKQPEINAPLVESYIHEARNIYLVNPGTSQKKRFRALRNKLTKQETHLQQAQARKKQ